MERRLDWDYVLCCSRGRRIWEEEVQDKNVWVREDPGTGSASSGLGCYLAGLEGMEKGVVKFRFEQGVEMGRRNQIEVDVTRSEGGEGVKKVILSGAAVTVMEGNLQT